MLGAVCDNRVATAIYKVIFQTSSNILPFHIEITPLQEFVLFASSSSYDMKKFMLLAPSIMKYILISTGGRRKGCM